MDTQMVLTHTGKIYFNRSLGLEFLTVGDYGKENNIKADFLGLTKKIEGVQHHDVDLMCKVYERPPLVLSEGMKLFAVNAGYRKTDVGTNWYYVRAKNAREARKRFKDRITWLDVYGVREVTDAALIQDVLSSPRKYICF